jgi:hypothetical protein
MPLRASLPYTFPAISKIGYLLQQDVIVLNKNLGFVIHPLDRTLTEVSKPANVSPILSSVLGSVSL